MSDLKNRLALLVSFVASATVSFPAPVFLDDQFELPAGFRIYRAAERDLTGGSYALRFDGQGRLLVGDGTALRRLADRDFDGVYDSYEVIATGLGWRGPQGILVTEIASSSSAATAFNSTKAIPLTAP